MIRSPDDQVVIKESPDWFISLYLDTMYPWDDHHHVDDDVDSTYRYIEVHDDGTDHCQRQPREVMITFLARWMKTPLQRRSYVRI